jgi:hypothetical protein
MSLAQVRPSRVVEWLVNNDLEGMWKTSDMALFLILHQNLVGGSGENQKPSEIIAGLRV